MATMSLTTPMAEFAYLLLLLWWAVWSLWSAVNGLTAIMVPSCDRVKGRVPDHENGPHHHDTGDTEVDYFCYQSLGRSRDIIPSISGTDCV